MSKPALAYSEARLQIDIFQLMLQLSDWNADNHPRYPEGSVVNGQNVGGKWMPKDAIFTLAHDVGQKVGEAVTSITEANETAKKWFFDAIAELEEGIDGIKTNFENVGIGKIIIEGAQATVDLTLELQKKVEAFNQTTAGKLLKKALPYLIGIGIALTPEILMPIIASQTISWGTVALNTAISLGLDMFYNEVFTLAWDLLSRTKYDFFAKDSDIMFTIKALMGLFVIGPNAMKLGKAVKSKQLWSELLKTKEVADKVKAFKPPAHFKFSEGARVLKQGELTNTYRNVIAHTTVQEKILEKKLLSQGIKEADIIEAKANLKKILGNSKIASRMPSRTVLKGINNKGRMMNSFENEARGRANGIYMKTRTEVEERVFGINNPFFNKNPVMPTSRPNYGILIDGTEKNNILKAVEEDYPRWKKNYGETVVVLKDHVKETAGFSAADTFSIKSASMVSDPSLHSLIPWDVPFRSDKAKALVEEIKNAKSVKDLSKIGGFSTGRNTFQYVETQFFGNITPKDFEYIIAPENKIMTRNIANKLLGQDSIYHVYDKFEKEGVHVITDRPIKMKIKGKEQLVFKEDYGKEILKTKGNDLVLKTMVEAKDKEALGMLELHFKKAFQKMEKRKAEFIKQGNPDFKAFTTDELIKLMKPFTDFSIVEFEKGKVDRIIYTYIRLGRTMKSVPEFKELYNKYYKPIFDEYIRLNKSNATT
jgi:hypothetical protein